MCVSNNIIKRNNNSNTNNNADRTRDNNNVKKYDNNRICGILILNKAIKKCHQRILNTLLTFNIWIGHGVI